MPRRPHRRFRSERHRRARGWNGWRWLGLGALALAGAALLRRPPQPPPATAAEPPEDPEPPDVLEPPGDTDSCWIAGPMGTLRVLERHPGGELAVVFIHGLGGRAEQWAALLEAAGPVLRAVAFDLPGHGLSDRAADGDYSIPAAAAAVGAVLDALGLRHSVLVAHSLGAAAAIEYADRHPQRVAGLLLVDPGGDQTRLPPDRRRELQTQLSRDPGEELPWYYRQLLGGARPSVADRVLEDLAAVPADVVLDALAAGAAYSPTGALERFSGPVKSLISDLNDLPYSLHRLLPELPALHLPRASHWLMLDRPAEVWAALVELLDEVETVSRRAPRPTPPAASTDRSSISPSHDKSRA
jgi:pimeloyl-ACP methyl ester carboxylesterase